MGIVICDNVSKSFKKNRAIKNLSCTFQENRITGLIGRNGAGKTTLLKTIAGRWRPNEGVVKVFDEDPYDNLKVSANMICVNDELVFSPELTLDEILKSGEMFYSNWDMEIAEGLFDYFELNPNLYHDQLSKGKLSTFNMIVGLASRCPLTIFDEPTTGMDYSVRQDFYRALLKDYINHPRTIILSSHLLNELEDILEDIVLIDKGEICLHESMNDLKEYAIRITGKREDIEPFIVEENILHKKKLEFNLESLVVKNEFSKEEIEQMKQRGIQILNVDAADLSMFLTGQSKGGIDDVF
ncbi:ABC transporter ATP-binding protein [Filobacillus milosensis]|uniref:ABC transporter ATP-binding protein n=1 Tax=Filobacillus milosensis TaxID=94137 RepID=A0A4Y8INN3_9BACI|nr:ABC transporter ATP-binding protein [Filobacillus milosensis]TFB22951.1 ABC transporter ATP-binding protein [Filobacillus milosensis]